MDLAEYREIPHIATPGRHDVVTIPLAETGTYSVQVVPEIGASPDDTFSLIVILNGVETILVKDAKVKDIPTNPYLVQALAKGTLAIDVKPDGDLVCHFEMQETGISVFVKQPNCGAELEMVGS